MSGIKKATFLLVALFSVIMFNSCNQKEEVIPSSSWATATIGGQNFTSVKCIVSILEAPRLESSEPLIYLNYTDARGERLVLYVPVSLQAGSETSESSAVLFMGENGTGHGPRTSSIIKVTYHDTDAKLIKGTFSGNVIDTRSGHGSLEVTDGKFEAEYLKAIR